MKKFLMILSTLVVLAAIAVIIVFFQMNNIIKVAIERYGSDVAGVPVKVGVADVSPTNGEGSLSSFSLGNPAGFKAENAFAVEKISLKVDKNSLTTDKVIVQEVSIESPRINYELAGNKNNFEVIRAHINKHLAKLSGSSMQDAENAIDKKQIIINDLYVKNGTITVSAPMIAGQSYHVALPDIHLQNLGKDEKPGNLPIIMQQIMMVLTGDVMHAVGGVTVKNFDKMVTQGGVDNPLNDVQKGLENVGDSIDHLIKE